MPQRHLTVMDIKELAEIALGIGQAIIVVTVLLVVAILVIG